MQEEEEKGRPLSVLGPFEPFGLTAQHLNTSQQIPKFSYSLFDPELSTASTRSSSTDPVSCDDLDEELFIHNNCVVWSAGLQVRKRFTVPSTVNQAVWCRFESISEPLLCILYAECLATFTPSGEMTIVPLPHAMASLWPVPCGLLLQRGTLQKGLPCNTITFANGNKTTHYNRRTSSLPSLSGIALSFSHFSLQHPLEEPQVLQYEEDGMMHGNIDPDEQIIWTNYSTSYLVSYHTGNRQHSVWKMKSVQDRKETSPGKTNWSHSVDASVIICLERVWQGDRDQSMADQVFLATDEDGIPILCFLMKTLKTLFAFRIPDSKSKSKEGKIAWKIPAVAAAPVIATRPWYGKSGKQYDLVILDNDGRLSLHRGKYHLSQLYFPWSTVKALGLSSNGLSMANGEVLNVSGTKEQIIGLGDPVQGRVNVRTSSGMVYRCSVSHLPSSSLTTLCLMALDQGIQNPIYHDFLASVWSHKYSWTDGPVDLNEGAGGNPDLEWASFTDTLIQWCNKHGISQTGHMLKASKDAKSCSPWDFLLNSSTHRRNKNIYPGLSFPSFQYNLDEGPAQANMEGITHGTSKQTSFLSEVLAVLHTVYENHKLDALHWRELRPLSSLLALLASSLHEWNYLDHYGRDFPDLYERFQGKLPHGKWQSLNVPFNIFLWLERCMRGSDPSASGNKLPSLYCHENAMCINFSRKVIAFYELLACRENCDVRAHIASGSFHTPEQRLVLAMVGEDFGLADLDRLPAGVSLPLRHALNSCREAPPADWPESAFVLVGREDLASMCNDQQKPARISCMAAPYMLHLRPVPVLSSESDTYENANTESISSGDIASDGMEHMFNGTIQLRFGRDLRLNEVRRLLCSSRPVAVRMVNPPDVSDPDIVAQQQAQLWQLAQRTTSLAFGRGAFTLGTMQTLVTEVLTIPKLVLAGRLPSQHDAMVNLDPSSGNLSDLTSWPEFHNGVAAGLRLATCQTKITRTWIVYNRPDEPNFAHAGLLMSLGLQGHLRVLAATDVYRYLSQEHEATTVGILLGMAAAHRGTMDPAISKILYLHIPARHPPSFPELELPTLMQSAALMAVGMLYQGSAHRLTTEILLAEIGRKPGSDNVLEREGYALAAGLALGLVTLGKGKSAWGLADLSIEERLLHYMSGGSDPGEGGQLRVDGMNNNAFSSSSRNFEDLYQNNGQVMEGSIVNLDVTAPGATLALGLMFLKTNNKEVAARLATPDTHFALEYVRPDFILLRVVARNLILWDSVEATEDWIQAQVPSIIKEFLASSAKDREDSDMLCTDVDMEALAQAHVNVLAGACLSIGLRYAGTSNADAQQLLYRYAHYFLKEKRSAAPLGGSIGPNGRCSYVDRGTLETCLNVAILSLSVVMAGSGHLGTFKLLRYLRRRNDVDGAISYGNHTAISMALGFLFLGGGSATFSTNNDAVAALLIALYPRFPTAPNDHRCHLQAFRHLYVLATEARCVQTIDVDTGLPVYAPLEITVQETSSHAETSFCHVSPCLLPERCLLKRVRVCGPRYWPQDLKLAPSGSSWWKSSEKSNPFYKGVLFVKRKVGARPYGDDPIGCRSLISRTLQRNVKDGHPAPSSEGDSEVEKVVSTFSADPSLLAFAEIFCTSRQRKSGTQFEEFCLQALLECVSSDKPALLQVYLSFYTAVQEFIDSLKNKTLLSSTLCSRSISLSSLKVALAYTDGIASKSLVLQGGPLLQQTFLAALAKQVDEILNIHCQNKAGPLLEDLLKYFQSFKDGHDWTNLQNPSLLTYYLRWHDIPYPSLINNAHGQLSKFLPSFKAMHDSLPLLALVLPGAAPRALVQISNLLCH